MKLTTILMVILLSGCSMSEQEIDAASNECLAKGMDAEIRRKGRLFPKVECMERHDNWSTSDE